RRALDQVDDQHIVVAPQADVLEEPGAEQRARGLHQTTLIHGVAHIERQRGEHAAGGDALQAIDPDVVDYEGLGMGLGDQEGGRPLTRVALTKKDSAWAWAIRMAASAAGSRRFMKSFFKTDY